MLVNVISDFGCSGLASMSDWNLQLFIGESLHKGIVLAQDLNNVDILRDIQKSWSNFVKTGQIWAMMIGIPLGWWLKSILRP